MQKSQGNIVALSQSARWTKTAVWTKWSELCFEKPASCFYGESWKKREFVQWNDCKGFLATWVRRCLSLSHPLLLPHHLSNGSSFRLPSVTTVHKQVGGAKKGLGMVSVGEQAILPAFPLSLPLSLERLQRCDTHDISFLNWVDAVYWHTYLSCVSACVSIHWVSSSKLRMRAILTENEFCLHIYPRLTKPFLLTFLFCWIHFVSFWRDDAPPFLFSCLVPVWIRNDLIGGLVGLFHHFSFSFFNCCFCILISTTAMNSRGCGLSVNALCCFRHISSSCGSELTWCCTMLPTTLFFPPNDIFSLVLIPLPPPTACIYCIHWPNIFSQTWSASIIFSLFGFSFVFNVCMLMKCHYSWGEHARKCHQIKHLEMRKKTDLSGCVLSVSECSFENTQMTWVFAMMQSTT